MAFGSLDDDGVRDDSHNLEVAKLIETLGKCGSGRRAIVKAIAERQGIVDEDQLEGLYAGSSDVKLRVPTHLRLVLREIGLGNVLAEVTF